MRIKPRMRHMPHALSWEWYVYIDVKVEGTSKMIRLSGFGWTPEGALQGLQESVGRRNKVLQRHGFQINVTLPTPKEIPKHCIATSNLPWWKRLFRL